MAWRHTSITVCCQDRAGIIVFDARTGTDWECRAHTDLVELLRIIRDSSVFSVVDVEHGSGGGWATLWDGGGIELSTSEA